MASDTSFWIDFFEKCGLPPSVSANYAVIFSDNRIKPYMLLDLNKEYLKDMGITTMGDIIAVLRYSRIAHGKYTQEKLLSSMSTAPMDLKAPSPPPKPPTPEKTSRSKTKSKAMVQSSVTAKLSTPATRMLEHYIREPEHTKVINYKEDSPVNEAPVGIKRRKLTEDTEFRKVKRLVEPERLGEVSSTTGFDDPSVSITGLGKTFVRTVQYTAAKSVFDRLGGKLESSTPEVTTGPPLDYQGVFKKDPFKPTTMRADKSGQRRVLNIKTRLGRNKPKKVPIKEPSQQTIFTKSLVSDTIQDKTDVKQRLGRSARNRASLSRKSVFSRLGS